MNPEDFSRDDLLREVNPLYLGGGILLAILLWLATWGLRNKLSRNKLGFAIPGFIFISAAFWLTFQLLGKWFALATNWSLIFLALLAGFAWELILWIYEFEKSLVTRKRGRWLLRLRLAALITIIIILLQPVRSFLEDREINREIAVLIDDSESMQLSDQRLSPSEVLDRAQLLGNLSVIEKRPPLRAISKQIARIKTGLSREIDAIAAAPSAAAGLESRAESLPEVFTQLNAENQKLSALLEAAMAKPGASSVRGQLNQFLGRSKQAISNRLKDAEAAVADGDHGIYILKMNESVVDLNQMLQSMDGLTAKVDESLLRSFPEAERKEVTSLALRSRYEIAAHAGEMTSGFAANETSKPLLESLGEKYNLRYYRFSRDIEEISSLGERSDDTIKTKTVRAQTDLTGAIEHVLDNSSPESLAGILLFSDGRHNAAGLPEDSLRQLAIQSSPLCAVPIGGSVGPVDASILSLSAPESIYLDDRVVIRTIAKMDGLLGKRIKAELLTDGKVVDEQWVNVTDVNSRNEIRFVHTPEEKGIIDYQVRLEADPRELFKNNNSWDFKVAVTDDRTNVLLVDGYPRWEFRYLRNLFYGRDKSVHLQYVLLNPDTISGLKKPPPIPASATRKFGDAEATELPKTPEEWQLFDVIILGDIEPGQLGSSDWRAIQEAVTKRGALLVCVAGPRFMPHDFKNETLKDLLPVTFVEWEGDEFKSPEDEYKVALTAAGKGHPITSQSTSRSLNTELWAEFPPLRWRWQSASVKEGAEVLAYAEPMGHSTEASNDATPSLNASPDSIEAALAKLTRQKEREKENALITTMRSGLGKVVMMNFDRTWRFRYGVGDTYHHRFWGQLTRWGAGPNLRSGNELIRLGTDRLSYTPSDEIVVTAKVLDATRKPITDASVFAVVKKNGRRVSKQKLSYRSDSSGIYETTFAGLSEEGEYTIELDGPQADRAVKADPQLQSLETELLVVSTRNPIELAELTADRDFLNRAASQTNGRIAELWELDSLLDAFGSPKEILRERRDVTLWDTWPLLAAFLGFLTFEWILRRKSGLV